MTSRTQTKQAVQGLEIGPKNLLKSEAVSTMKPGREFASLSDARAIKESDWYWISPKSKEVAPREVTPGNGKESYKGRTFEGVPSISGDFKDNKDGTFTQLKDYRHADLADRVYVSLEAAAKVVKGEGPLALLVRDDGVVFYFGRLLVLPVVGLGDVARVASVPQAQAVLEAATQKVALGHVDGRQIIIALERDKISSITKAIIDLANTRTKSAAHIAEVKMQAGMPVVDPEREVEIKETARAYAEKVGFNPDAAEELVNALIKEARRVQENKIEYRRYK